MRHLVWALVLVGCGGPLDGVRAARVHADAPSCGAPSRSARARPAEQRHLAVRASTPSAQTLTAASPPSRLGRAGVVEWGEAVASTVGVQDGEVWLDVTAAPAGARCTSPGDCEVWADYLVASGASVELSLYKVKIANGQGARVEYELAPGTVTLAPATQRALRIDHRRPGNDAVVLVFTTPDGTTLETEPSITRIRDLARDEALAACEACHGVFGAWGIGGREGCNCRTRDVGAECRDGLACEGECEPVRVEPVVVDGAVVGRRRVGRCSEFRMRFGCHARIPDAALLEPPLPATGALRMTSVCVD